ncbi:MAG: adenylosuccinate lyase [Acidobacteriota bacterium]
MIDRYSRPEMASIWSNESKFRKWLDVEIAVCEILNEEGKIPDADLKNIKRKASFDLTRIKEIEKEVKHDVIAFMTSIAEKVGKSSRFIHQGLTSYDVVDTANALLLREACNILLDDTRALLKAIKEKSLEYKDVPMMGRTHGVHAEPITFGLKLALWYEEMKRNIQRLEAAREGLMVGKISGAVGAFAHLSPEVEEKVCRKLGLKAAPVSSQIIQRDRYAFLLAVLAIMSSSLDKFAIEIRNLQRTEIREVEEYFLEGQKGSSAMPHKRNPISCEQISGLARVIRGNAFAALENIPLWHERDISNSSVERIILPDSTILMDYMLAKFTEIVKNLIVYPERMLQNIGVTRGLIFSQALLLALTRKGASREKAYRWVQRNTVKVWKEDLDFKTLIKKDSDIRKMLTPDEIDRIFDLRIFLKNIDKIFKRVYGK